MKRYLVSGETEFNFFKQFTSWEWDLYQGEGFHESGVIVI
jgi:hypothetical protein